MMAAGANALDEGMEFIRKMAFNPTYGASVLAALTHHDPDWWSTMPLDASSHRGLTRRACA